LLSRHFRLVAYIHATKDKVFRIIVIVVLFVKKFFKSYSHFGLVVSDMVNLSFITTYVKLFSSMTFKLIDLYAMIVPKH